MRPLIAITALTALTVLVGAHAPASAGIAGDSAQGPAHDHVGVEATVSIRTFQFSPDTLRVKVGTRVVWSNLDEIEHTITSGTPDSADGRFNGVVDRRGATYSAVPRNAGTYRYFCDRHRFMNGTVIVSR
jgi:plastocyanin